MATIHNPTNFDPAAYEVLDYLDNKRPVYVGEGVAAYDGTVWSWEADMLDALGPDWRLKKGRCVHCGNGRVRWITVCKHLPTGDRVVFGSDCTDRLGFANKVAFKLALLKSRADARAESLKAFTKREAFLAANAPLAAVVAGLNDPAHAKNSFVHDVMAKFFRYGDLSPRQLAAVVDSFNRDLTFAARKAVEDAEVKGAAPSGKASVTGVVLSIQDRESAYGVVTKTLLKLGNNSKVWVTLPGAASNVKRGDTLALSATWEVSKDDKSFAFGKRPFLLSHTPAAPVAAGA
jgi:hypothetical protein